MTEELLYAREYASGDERSQAIAIWPNPNTRVMKCKVDTVGGTVGAPLCPFMPATRSLPSSDPPDPGPAEPIRPQHPGRQASDRAGNGC